jgi:molecular chaperone DnaJ
MAQTCYSCGGQGEVVQKVKKKSLLKVKVPGGIDHDQRLRLTGEGQPGLKGGPSGDLYVHVSVKEHQIFQRDGFDVFCEVPVSFAQAALGCDLKVPTLNGQVLLNVKAGTQSGQRQKLKNKGITRLDGRGMGDQIVTIKVETPTALSGKQREIYEQLRQLEEENNNQTNPMTKGFFDKVKELFQ